LEHAEDDGSGVRPGQGVAYVVVDGSKRSLNRVWLPDEAESYDATLYAEELVRAAESVLASLDWRQEDIAAYLADRTDANRAAIGTAEEGR
jgi:DNA polymerase elongation subunit (family B)